MKITVDLPERLYKYLVDYCSQNDMTIEDYVYEIVSNNFYTEMYGDINPKEPVVEETSESVAVGPAIEPVKSVEVENVVVPAKTEPADTKVEQTDKAPEKPRRRRSLAVK